MSSSKLIPVIFFLLAFGVLCVGYIHFFILSPSFIQKPTLEYPSIIENETFSEYQVYYLLNEMDAYKLRSHPISKEPPIIEFVVEGESFLVAVINNNFEIVEEADPDIRFYLSEADLYGVLQSNDFQEKIIEKYSNDEIKIDIVAEPTTLALKGYKAIYDRVSKSNELTGNIVKLNPDNFTNGINITLLFFIALLLEMIIKKI